MEDLRLLLLLLGAFVIVGIFIHGVWTIRKNAKGREQARYEPREWKQEEDFDLEDDEISGLGQDDIIDADISADDGFAHLSATKKEPQYDELGVGAVKVVSKPSSQPVVEKPGSQATPTTQDAESDSPNSAMTARVEPTKTEPKPEPVKIYKDVVTRPKPGYVSSAPSVKDASPAATIIPEPPQFLLIKDKDEPVAEPELASAKQPLDTPTEQETSASVRVETRSASSLADRAKRFVQPAKNERKRREPKIADDQMSIDFGGEDATSSQQPSKPAQTSPQGLEPEVLILNVKARDDQPIQGAALLPMLLTLGFKFGDQDIFHRHQHTDGTGPVLFSLANMFKPGVFDIDNLENFTTQGISLFMILPMESDPHQVFNMMHNAARKLADEFSATVLDGRRSSLNKQSLQQYVEKIREFERKRMIAR